MPSLETMLPPESGDTVSKPDGAADHQRETEKPATGPEPEAAGSLDAKKPATGPEPEAAGSLDAKAASESVTNSATDIDSAEKQNDTAETTVGKSDSKDGLNDDNRDDSMVTDDNAPEGSKDKAQASSTTNGDDPKTEFIDRRIAKRFRVLTTNRRHQGTVGKVNRIFFGTVERLVPSNVELWRILYDDGDVDLFSRPKLIEALDYYDVNKVFDTNHSHKKSNSLSLLDNGEEEDENSMDTAAGSTKKRGKTAKTKATPPKKGKKAKPKVVRAEPVPVWEGLPDEEIEGGWPKGWAKKLFARKNGDSKGKTDRYWYSPKEKFKLRSLVQVTRFLKALKDAEGDEIKAKQNMHKF